MSESNSPITQLAVLAVVIGVVVSTLYLSHIVSGGDRVHLVCGIIIVAVNLTSMGIILVGMRRRRTPQ